MFDLTVVLAACAMSAIVAVLVAASLSWSSAAPAHALRAWHAQRPIAGNRTGGHDPD